MSGASGFKSGARFHLKSLEELTVKFRAHLIAEKRAAAATIWTGGQARNSLGHEVF